MDSFSFDFILKKYLSIYNPQYTKCASLMEYAQPTAHVSTLSLYLFVKVSSS